MEYLYSLTVALFLTISLIPVFKRYAPQMGLIDDPSADRKVHTTAMPRTGGLGIILGAALPIAFLLPLEGYLINLFVGCLVIIVFGLLDDRFELNYKYKLFGQSLAVIVVMSGGVVFIEFPFFGADHVPVWLSYPFTFLFLVGVVNGVNFSDGLDGLAAGTSIMSLLLIFVLALQSSNVEVALIAVTIVGGLLGFLRYNTFPANVFMGDAGSQFLGFIIACLAIVVTQEESAPFSVLLPILILGIPIMDILQVVPVRVHKQLPLPGPDKEHFHHQLVKLGFRHIEVVSLIYILQAVLVAGAFFLRYEADWHVALFYGVFVVLVLASILGANFVGWQFRAKYRAQVSSERRNKYLRRIHWYYSNSARILAVQLAVFFLVIGWLFGGKSVSIFLLALSALAVTGCLWLSRWQQSRLFFRIVLYTVSVMAAYFIAAAPLSLATEHGINGFLAILLLLLVLAIRMTRKQEFTLTTQDLLILLVVLLLPLLPFDAMSQYAIGKMALVVAVLMYTCEFVINRATRTVSFASAAGIVALALIADL